MFAAICIEKTPFTSFHNSKMVIPLLAVLEPLWLPSGSYPGLHTSLTFVWRGRNNIICCWFIGLAVCPVPNTGGGWGGIFGHICGAVEGSPRNPMLPPSPSVRREGDGL